MTQAERIREYMERFGSISPFEAFQDLGITKLSTRIGEMRDSGIPIFSDWFESKNRYGDKVRYKRYWLG